MNYIAQAETLFLILVRITSFFVVAPFFGMRAAPGLVKASLGFIVAVLLFPLLGEPQNVYFNSWAYVLAVLNEALTGLALGFIANLIFSAIQVAGQILDVHMGLAMASILDPQNATRTTLVGQFLAILGLLLFFEFDGHHALLLALKESFKFIPLGGVDLDGGIVWAVVKIFCRMFSLALRLASPIIAMLVLSDLALSLVARTVPQLNVFILGFPLKVGLGLLILIAILPLLAVVFNNIISQMERDLALIVRSWVY